MISRPLCLFSGSFCGFSLIYSTQNYVPFAMLLVVFIFNICPSNFHSFTTIYNVHPTKKSNLRLLPSYHWDLPVELNTFLTAETLPVNRSVYSWLNYVETRLLQKKFPYEPETTITRDK